MAFVPAHTISGEAGAGPERTVFVLHGIFGAGRNWRSFAGQLVEACPGWRAVLVDLRNHGRSRGAPPPHTLGACARDLHALAEVLGGPAAAVVGHSFGGKVAIAYAAARPAGLRALWVLDSPPGARPPTAYTASDSDVARALVAMRGIRMPLSRRSHLGELMISGGVSEAVASWMATNLEPAPGGGFTWSFDLGTLGEMLDDYWRQDCWPFLEAPPPGLEVHFVRAAESDRWRPEDLDRLARLDAAGRLRFHVLERAGHWLQTDNPNGLLRLMAPSLAGKTENPAD